MNERIKLLAKQYLMYERYSRYGESTEEEYYDFLPEELEEFVGLIVKECANIVASSSLPDAYSEPCLEVIADEIKEHFGVS